MSAPPTPPSEMPAVIESRFKPKGTPCERADAYRPGGFYPVHFGDVLRQRYRVIRKLGYGSFATVWLAADIVSSTYVALKIHAARVDVANELSIQRRLRAKSCNDPDSNFILLLSDTFVLESPNGKHSCFVMEAMGPSMSAVLNATPKFYDPLNPPDQRFPTARSRTFLRNILSGLQYLHANLIVHGDLQSGNVLFAPHNLSALNPGELEQNATTSTLDPLVRIDGKTDRWAPKYLAVAEPLAVSLTEDEQCVKLVDFGSSFWIDNPPTSIVTPLALRAPEVILHHSLGPAIDIWSFGCIMFELLTDQPLFELFTFGRQKVIIDDDHLIKLSGVVGPLPERLRARWPRYSTYFGPGGERLVAQPSDFDESQIGLSMRARSNPPSRPHSYASLEDKFFRHRPTDMDDVESEEIASLLRDILQVDPDRRPSAVKLLDHPWFQVTGLLGTHV